MRVKVSARERVAALLCHVGTVSAYEVEVRLEKGMDGWLAQVKQRYKAVDGAGFAALVDPDPTSTAFAALQHSLRVRVASSMRGL